MNCTDSDGVEEPRLAEEDSVMLAFVEDKNVSGTMTMEGGCTCIWCRVLTYVEQSASYVANRCEFAMMIRKRALT
jgi:hypothetical protein